MNSIEEYIDQVVEAEKTQPRLWSYHAGGVTDDRKVILPTIGAVRASELSEPPDTSAGFTEGPCIEVRPVKYGMAFTDDCLPEPEELAKFLDGILWRLCLGGPLGNWNLTVNPELTLPEWEEPSEPKYKLYIRYHDKVNGPWAFEENYNLYKDERHVLVSARIGLIDIAELS